MILSFSRKYPFVPHVRHDQYSLSPVWLSRNMVTGVRSGQTGQMMSPTSGSMPISSQPPNAVPFDSAPYNCYVR